MSGMIQSTRTRMAAYPATDGKGKWHAATVVSGVSACGGNPVLLDVTASPIFALRDLVHPLICKRCWAVWKAATK